MAYILPQVVINQLFSEVPLNTIQNQNVLVFGPNYQCYRYSDDSVKESLYLGTHDGTGVKVDGDYANDFEYPGRTFGSDIDTGFVKLFGDDVQIELTDVTGWKHLGDAESGLDIDSRMKLSECVAGKFRDDAKFPRDIEAGDMISIKYGSGDDDVFKSIILEVFETEKDSGKFDGIRVEDTLPDDLKNHDGIPAGGSVEASDEGEAALDFDTNKIMFVACMDGVEIPVGTITDSNNVGIRQWTADNDGIRILSASGATTGNLECMYPAWDTGRHEILSAKLYVEYREFQTTAADTLHTIGRTTDVEAVLGEDTPDNPLAFGVKKALQNSADRVVYYMATRGTSREDYNEVLRAASKTDKVYILVPLTNDSDIIDDVKAHVLEMSTGSKKLWRISVIASEVPEENVLYTKAASTDGNGFFAKLSSKTAGTKTKYIVSFVEGEDNPAPNTTTKCATQVVPGDFVRVYTGKKDPWTREDAFVRFRVAASSSNTELILENSTQFPAPEASMLDSTYRVEVVHDLTHAEQAEAIAATSRHYMSRRIYNVFPSYAKTNGVMYGGEMLAAAVAGVVSSVLPQQPITNVELIGVDDVPMTYESFSREELDTIAEGGTLIVMQDLPGDRVYVRHQISTEYSSNNLLKAELSITKNLDSIAYYFAEAFKPYIGKYNITPELIAVLNAVASTALGSLQSSTASGLLGPQVLVEGTEIVDLYQDPVNQDHVYMHLKLNLPRPFNVLDVDLEVI